MIEDVCFKCEACEIRKIMTVPPGVRSSLEELHHFLKHGLPPNWRRSFGSSGKGFYHLCDECIRNKVCIDDIGRNKVICYGGFND